MKKLILLGLVCLSSFVLNAQPSPVQWEFSAQLLEENKYELHFTASIDGNWNIYSQFLAEGGPVPTSFEYENQEGFEFIGKCQEIGKKKEGYDNIFEMDVVKFGKNVDFVQTIMLKEAIDFIKGSVEFMVCNEESCLPPKLVDFNIGLK